MWKQRKWKSCDCQRIRRGCTNCCQFKAQPNVQLMQVRSNNVWSSFCLWSSPSLQVLLDRKVYIFFSLLSYGSSSTILYAGSSSRNSVGTSAGSRNDIIVWKQARWWNSGLTVGMYKILKDTQVYYKVMHFMYKIMSLNTCLTCIKIN